MIKAALCFCIACCHAGGVLAGVPDVLVPIRLDDVAVKGHVAKVQDRFVAHRILSEHAKREIWGEARASAVLDATYPGD